MNDGDGYLILAFICFAIGFLGMIHNLSPKPPENE